MGIIKPFRIKSFKNKNPIIEFKNISISFGNRTVLDNVNFIINEKTIHGLLGPNGAGKSTMYHLITGLLEPKHGKILINNQDVTNLPVYLRTREFGISFVPQYGGTFSDLTLDDNLKAISEIVINNKNLRLERINYLISKLELQNIRNVKSKNLSGGERKKLTIALSLLSKPKILLLDEPFSALDVLTIKMLQELIINLQQENNITICICDHLASSLLQISDTAMILSNGKIVAQNSPSNLIKDIHAQNAYFGNNFKIN
ncbi:ATP-binding cassette domain-containing protein [Candidatus Pelagibacter sp. HIMB1506]|uniref:ATP-binding cassette domain-containing protein n=1 Tax=Candidatus Pelagibacter sp. HIMB1506 TaxID=3413337 RepID=UPI003F865420